MNAGENGGKERQGMQEGNVRERNEMECIKGMQKKGKKKFHEGNVDARKVGKFVKEVQMQGKQENS